MDQLSSSSSSVINGMAPVRKIKGDGQILIQLRDYLFNLVLSTGFESARTDVVSRQPSF